MVGVMRGGVWSTRRPSRHQLHTWVGTGPLHLVARTPVAWSYIRFIVDVSVTRRSLAGAELLGRNEGNRGADLQWR